MVAVRFPSPQGGPVASSWKQRLSRSQECQRCVGRGERDSKCRCKIKRGVGARRMGPDVDPDADLTKSQPAQEKARGQRLHSGGILRWAGMARPQYPHFARLLAGDCPGTAWPRLQSSNDPEGTLMGELSGLCFSGRAKHSGRQIGGEPSWSMMDQLKN